MKSNFFCTERELLNIRITLPSAKLDMVGSRLVSNDLLFLVRVSQYPVSNVLLLSYVRTPSIGWIT